MDHDYSVIGGTNRATIGRWIQVTAAAVSGVAVFAVLSVFDIAERAGLAVNIPPVVMSLIGAGTVYLVLYWLFSHHVWKLGPIARLLRVPHLAGRYSVVGEALDKPEPVAWSGTITIVQTWDKIRVHLKTAQSSSDSVTAALVHDEAAGYRLMYHYANRPKIGEAQLSAHHGFAELVFATDCQSAMGEYFNGRGRNTYGTMTLERMQD